MSETIAERLCRERPDIVLTAMDYGQEVTAERPGHRGCFLRFGQRHADPARYDEILRWIDTPRLGRRLTRAEAAQFLGAP